VLEQARSYAEESGGSFSIVHDVQSAVANADVVYTDTWMSYHIPPEEHERRFQLLEPFRVTEAIMKQASPKAIFMHCLPAQRGNEQTAAVIDGPQSVVFDQAENRLHIEKAILVKLLGRKISQE
jgi:ornithine carbamoyltransferase